jgi:hypothetical protein
VTLACELQRNILGMDILGCVLPAEDHMHLTRMGGFLITSLVAFLLTSREFGLRNDLTI